LKWGSHLESGYYHKLLAEGKVRPEDVEPEISYLEWYIEAFYELSSERQFGMGIGPIPFSSIVTYAEVFEINDFDDFHYVIRILDKVYLD